MNGRVYDPVLGRFLSPDNYVQMPDFSQSFNRYSYCLNNPLKYKDPDGEAWWIIPMIIGGAYLGGVAMNKGELNPLNWDYSNPFTYIGIGVGAIAGGISGSVIAGSTAWGITFGVESAYIAGGLTIAATANTGLSYGFHWTTAGGGGGSISNVGSPDRNVDASIAKVRKEESNYRQMISDYNNMIGDVSRGINNYGKGYIMNIASSVNKYSSRLGYLWDYGGIISDVVNTTSISKESQRDIFTITGGNIGANIMGTSLGIFAAGLASETGPIGVAYFGALGVSSGRVLGREMGSYIGGYLFDNIYTPYIYTPMNRIRMINIQLRNEIEYNKQFIPDYWNYPY